MCSKLSFCLYLSVSCIMVVTVYAGIYLFINALVSARLILSTFFFWVLQAGTGIAELIALEISKQVSIYCLSG